MLGGIKLLLFLKSTLIFMLILLIVWALPFVFLPEIFGYILPDGFWITIYMIIPPIIHIVLIVLYYIKGYPLFALPLSHFLFPFFLIATMYITSMLRITPTHGDWALSAMAIAFIYFLPFAIITFVISLIIRLRS